MGPSNAYSVNIPGPYLQSNIAPDAVGGSLQSRVG